MNEIVFLRHGHALSAREAGVTADAERPLSPLGEAEARAAAQRLRSTGFAPAMIISSPFLRAGRTAELASLAFPSAERRTAAALSDGPAQAVLDLIEGLPEGSVLLVGHQPLLGAVAGFLLGTGPLDFSPAGFARIRRGSSPSLVEFYAPAEAR